MRRRWTSPLLVPTGYSGSCFEYSEFEPGLGDYDMAYLTDPAEGMFQLRAEESPGGSTDEVLFSGLARLARTVSNIEMALLNLEREVRSIESAER